MDYKFIFDNSVLDQSNIAKLKGTRLIEGCASGALSFYMTPILLEEALHFIPSGRMPQQLVEIFRFIQDLSWSRLYNTVKGSDGIYAMELNGHFPSEYLFAPDKYVRQTVNDLCNGGEAGVDDKEAIKTYNASWKQRKGENREIYREIRDNVKIQDGFSFQDYVQRHIEERSIYKITKSINSTKPKEELISYWKAHKERCPHFNKFVEGEMYIVYYAYRYKGEEAKNNPLDTNAPDDVEYLVYLNDVDCIVSNDNSFMRQAAKELFPQKDFFSVEEFIDRIRNV